MCNLLFLQFEQRLLREVELFSTGFSTAFVDNWSKTRTGGKQISVVPEFVPDAPTKLARNQHLRSSR
jgi:hypothetical protein